jgi:2'-5' RNA ligase
MLDRSRDIRVFIALLIPTESRAILSETMGRLQAQVPTGVKWVDPQGIHLTLKFFGNINSTWKEPVLEAMGDVGRQATPFNLELSSLGVFPNERQPRVLWSGVNGDMEALAGLQEEVEQAMLALGFRREKRRFNPHLTIGRVRDGVGNSARQQIGKVMSATVLGPVEPWTVDAMHLVQSTLTPQGAIYDSLGHVPLFNGASG